MYHLYLPFNIAIAAVSPIEEHDSAACVWNYTGLHEPHDHPASEIKECLKSSLSMDLIKTKRGSLAVRQGTPNIAIQGQY